MTALADAIKAIEAEFGEGALRKLGSKDVAQVPSIPTGSGDLDEALGIGGVPQGRIVEIFGPESSGKTTLVYHIIANAQAMGGPCAFIDAEHALDPIYAGEIGVDTDELLVNQPDYGEQALEIADRLIRAGGLAVIAIDSVAALTPRAELEGEMGEATVGLLARLMSQAMRKIAGNANRSGTTVVFTNQNRTNINMTGYGPKDTQPGGRALKYYASQRLDIRRIETLRQGDEATGNKVRVKVVKNKLAAPHRQAEFEIEYGHGINQEAADLDKGLADGTYKRSGAWFDLGPYGKHQGRPAAIQALRREEEK
jgi:recombination protein RecA